MNFMDYCFITILLLSGFAGAYQGLVRSSIGIISIVVTFFVSITCYSNVATAIKKHTPIYDALKEASAKTMSQNNYVAPGIDKASQVGDNTVNTLLNKIAVPPQIREFILSKVNISANNINVSQIIDILSAKSADIFVNVLGFVILFAILQFLFVLIQNALGAIFSMPILNEVNILGGFGIGVLQGVVTLFVICAAWSLFSGSMMYKEVFIDLNASKYAKLFYDHNLLLDILVKYKII